MNALHCAESLNAAITLGIEGTNLKASKFTLDFRSLHHTDAV